MDRNLEHKMRNHKDLSLIVATQINRDGQIRTHTLGKKRKKSYGSERFARNPTRELTLFLPAKKVTLKTSQGQNQPLCK